VGTVNKIVAQLAEASLVEQDRGPPRISPRGIQALEPFRAKRAVFLAAGFGSRLAPITLNTPKSLVRVKGTRIIDTLLDAVAAVGIRDIVIVRGYLAEQFDQLLYKYPTISFLENPLYNESNNISSAFCARYQLQNAYVLESDLLLRNPGLIKKYQYTSNYLAVPTERTDDWCFETRNGVIAKLRLGGRNCHHMFGISYWDAADGAKLAEHIRQVYEMPGGRERYWDQVALEYFSKDYAVEIRECSFDDIIEIDTFSELKKIDPTYRG
jgi:CTP:phosphocholine cytidylyltransferase-like protein